MPKRKRVKRPSGFTGEEAKNLLVQLKLTPDEERKLQELSKRLRQSPPKDWVLGEPME